MGQSNILVIHIAPIVCPYFVVVQVGIEWDIQSIFKHCFSM